MRKRRWSWVRERRGTVVLLAALCSGMPAGAQTGAAADAGRSSADGRMVERPVTRLQYECQRHHEVTIKDGERYVIGSSLAMTCPVHAAANSRIVVRNGAVLTLAGGFDAPLQQVFEERDSGRVRFGPETPEVPVEWFGAVGDYDLGSGRGRDNTAAIQQAIDSLTAGHAVLLPKTYRVAGTLTITRSSIGLRGTSAGYSYPSRSPVSLLMETTAGADAVRVTGTSAAFLVWNDLRDFSIQRSVIPTGTATGLAISFAGGYSIDHVQVQDSVRGFSFHAAPNYGVGSVSNSNAGWGYAGVNGYRTAVYGFYLDSEDGNAENTIVFNNVATANNDGAGFQSFGMYMVGKAINDVDVHFLATSHMSIGLYVKYDGPATTPLAAYDLHFHNVTIDASTDTGVYLSGLSAAAEGMIDFTAGWVASIEPGYKASFDCEDSSGVAISKMQIISQHGSGVVANGCSSMAINDNLFSRTTGSFITLNRTTSSVIANNLFRAEAGFPTKTMVQLHGSSRNTLLGNALTGPAAVGFDFDAGSLNNSFGGNSIDTATIPAGIQDASGGAGATSFAVQNLVAGGVALPREASGTGRETSVGVAGTQPEFEWYLPAAGENARRVRMRGSIAQGNTDWSLEANSDDGHSRVAFMTFGLTPGAAVQGTVPTFPLGMATPLRTPRSSKDTCTTGQFEDDANYHYVCTATNTWKRVKLSRF